MKIKSKFLFIAAGFLCLLLDNIFDIDKDNVLQANLLPLIPIAASGLLNFGSSLLSGLFGSRSAAETNALNREMFERNLEYQNYWNSVQYSMADNYIRSSFKFNQDESERARQHDFDLFNVEALWNSYPNQRKLMEQAGLNPAMMFSGGQTLGNVSAPNSGAAAHVQPSMPNLGFSPSPIPQMHSKSSASAEMIKAASGAIKDLTDSIGSTAKLQPEISQIQENVHTMQSQQRVNDSVVQLNEADEQYKVTLNQLEQISLKYKDQKEFATINNICAETQKYLSDAYLAGLQGETEIANAKLREAEASLMKFKETSEREQLPLILSNLKKQGKLIDAQAANAYMTGSAAQVAASAQKIIALATSAEKQEVVKKLQKEGEYLQSMITGQRLGNAFDLVTFMNRAESIAQTLASEKIITNQQFEQLRMLKKQNNWYEIMNVLNAVSLGLIGGGQAAQGASSVYKTFGGSKPMGKIGF